MKKYLAIFKFNLKSEFNFKVDYLFSMLSFAVHIFVFNALPIVLLISASSSSSSRIY